jgi:hypothetical protein
MLNALLIIRMHDESTLAWHGTPPDGESGVDDTVMAAVLAQHRANFDLWHEEDKARDPSATDAQTASVKHAIDAVNQRRNDLVEAIDRLLLAEAGHQNEDAPLHSETPGMIVDRLSILSLKLYHTQEEACRATATDAHRQRNLERLAVLGEQRDDLAACLDRLWREIQAGARRFKLYRQMKMYNDPDLNPRVYSRKTG